VAINFSGDLYSLCQQVFAVPVTVHPVFSQPDGASYEARGIFGQQNLDVMAEDGSIFSTQQDILDIRIAEFPVPPMQKDRVTIPYNSSGEPLGEFEVTDTYLNGGGEMTLHIRKWRT
jgi:hypothetical protein